MAKDQSNQGGPTRNPKDEPTRDHSSHEAESRAQSQSKPIGDDERDNREGAGESRRNGTESNSNNKRS